MVHKNLCTIFIQNYYKIKTTSKACWILFLKLILFYLINKKFYRRRKRLIFLCYNIQINWHFRNNRTKCQIPASFRVYKICEAKRIAYTFFNHKCCVINKIICCNNIHWWIISSKPLKILVTQKVWLAKISGRFFTGRWYLWDWTVRAIFIGRPKLQQYFFKSKYRAERQQCKTIYFGKH